MGGKGAGCAAGEIPEPRCAVAARRNEQAFVFAQLNQSRQPDCSGMFGKNMVWSFRIGHIPNAHGFILTRGREPFAVAAPGQAGDRSLVAGEKNWLRRLARGPEPSLTAVPTGPPGPAVGV